MYFQAEFRNYGLVRRNGVVMGQKRNDYAEILMVGICAILLRFLHAAHRPCLWRTALLQLQLPLVALYVLCLSPCTYPYLHFSEFWKLVLHNFSEQVSTRTLRATGSATAQPSATGRLWRHRLDGRRSCLCRASGPGTTTRGYDRGTPPRAETDGTAPTSKADFPPRLDFTLTSSR